jgi:DNA-directed RNA polymerase sigma subunit (sigma70/sigma32)
VPDPKAAEPTAFSEATDLRHELQALVDALPDERMRYIVRERFWMRRDLEAIGVDMGLTAERARQLEQEAFRLLRRPLSHLGT